MVLYSLVISRSRFEAILMIRGAISLEITYSLKPQIRQNQISKVSLTFPSTISFQIANSLSHSIIEQ